MADHNSSKIYWAIGNVSIAGTGSDSTAVETRIDGVKVVNGGYGGFTGPGLFTLTAPKGCEFASVQTTTILSSNLQVVATNILSNTFNDKSLGRKVVIDYSSGASGSSPAVGVSLIMALRRGGNHCNGKC